MATPRERGAAVADLFDRVADEYDNVGVDWFGPIAAGLVAALEPRPGERGLDIGCGRGQALFALADAVGPYGRVTGIDVSPRMVAATRRTAVERRLSNVDVHVMDAAAPTLDPVGYDLVTASFVLFFLPAPAAALRTWRRLVRPTGRLGLSTFGQTGGGLFEEVFAPFLPPPAFGSPVDSPFSTDDGLAGLLTAAGFTSVRSQPYEVRLTFADLDQWCAWSWSHGQRATWERIPTERHDEVRQAMASFLSPYRQPDGSIRLTQSVRLTVARP